MTSKTAYSHGPSLSRFGGCKVASIALLTMALAGCKHGDDGSQVAGWALTDPSQRHPILVSQQPSHMNLHVARGSQGLSPAQRADVMEFASRYRASDSGNSRLVIAAPSGSPNEVAAMNAVQDIRDLLLDSGFNDAAIAVEAFHDESDTEPAIRISYMRYVAEGPRCGQDWSQNLAFNPNNVGHPNFGCANQRNLAAMIANPADLLGPRTMGDRYAERRDDVYKKYVKGETTGADKSDDERVRVKE